MERERCKQRLREICCMRPASHGWCGVKMFVRDLVHEIPAHYWKWLLRVTLWMVTFKDHLNADNADISTSIWGKKLLIFLSFNIF